MILAPPSSAFGSAPRLQRWRTRLGLFLNLDPQGIRAWQQAAHHVVLAERLLRAGVTVPTGTLQFTPYQHLSGWLSGEPIEPGSVPPDPVNAAWQQEVLDDPHLRYDPTALRRLAAWAQALPATPLARLHLERLAWTLANRRLCPVLFEAVLHRLWPVPHPVPPDAPEDAGHHLLMALLSSSGDLPAAEAPDTVRPWVQPLVERGYVLDHTLRVCRPLRLAEHRANLLQELLDLGATVRDERLASLWFQTYLFAQVDPSARHGVNNAQAACRMLIEAGASANARSEPLGETPLHQLLREHRGQRPNYLDQVERAFFFWVGLGADSTLREASGTPPLHAGVANRTGMLPLGIFQYLVRTEPATLDLPFPASEGFEGLEAYTPRSYLQALATAADPLRLPRRAHQGHADTARTLLAWLHSYETAQRLEAEVVAAPERRRARL